MTDWKRCLLASAAVAVCSTGGVAAAQEADGTSGPVESSRTLNTVTVTAQRREEDIQDVPLSVTAADAETLADLRVDNIQNISLLTPIRITITQLTMANTP